MPPLALPPAALPVWARIVIVPPKPPGGPISLPVWLVISLVCGFLSYRFVPAIFTSVERATGLLEANAGVDASTTAQ